MLLSSKYTELVERKTNGYCFISFSDLFPTYTATLHVKICCDMDILKEKKTNNNHNNT